MRSVRYLLIACMLASCAPPPEEPDAGLDQEKATIQGMANAIAASAQKGRAVAQAGVLPADYRKQVDAKLADILIDPDSRKVQFVSNPYGGLVCGLVNSKNRMGGYAGKEPFFAVFDANQTLLYVHTYTWDQVAAQRGTDLGEFTDCHF